MRITSFVALLSFVIVLCLLLVTTTANGAVIPPSEANNQTGERLFCSNFNNNNFMHRRQGINQSICILQNLSFIPHWSFLEYFGRIWLSIYIKIMKKRMRGEHRTLFSQNMSFSRTFTENFVVFWKEWFEKLFFSLWISSLHTVY